MWRWLFAQRLDRRPLASAAFAADTVRSGLSATASRLGQVGSGPERATDGLLNTQYSSKGNATAGDYVEVRFAQGMARGSFVVLTGYANGKQALADGIIEVSYNGVRFQRLTNTNGSRTEVSVRQPIRALRVTVGKTHSGPLVVREILIGDEAAGSVQP
jgi:hypothetical protein